MITVTKLGLSFLILIFIGSPALYAESHPLGDNRHLFLDQFLIAEMENARIAVNRPERESLVVIADKPWESGGITSYGNVLYDPYAEEYKLYYVPVSWDVEPGFCTAMATSKDGIHWDKPNLGVVEWKGSKDNNIVVWAQREGTVLIDPNAPPEHRFGFVSSEGKTKTRLFTSRDGIHFTLQEGLISSHHSDSQISTFWDDSLEKFVHFFKAYQGDEKWHTDSEIVVGENIPFPQNEKLGRSVARVETEHLGDVWEEPFEVVMARDERDPQAMDLYTNAAIQYPWAEAAYFAFPTPYYHYNEPASRAYLNQPTLDIGGKGNDGVIETQLATSRDGKRWTRYRTPYIPLHRYEDLELKVIHIYPGMVREGEEIVQYYAGYTFTHGDTQVRYKNLGRKLGGIFRVVQRRDGFVSVDFDYEGGELITEPFTFEGDSLRVNLNTSSAGEARLAILDEEGKEIPGYSLEECRIINGDYLDTTVAWKDGQSDVSGLRGKSVRLKFDCRGTKLYSFQFGNSND